MGVVGVGCLKMVLFMVFGRLTSETLGSVLAFGPPRSEIWVLLGFWVFLRCLNPLGLSFFLYERCLVLNQKL